MFDLSWGFDNFSDTAQKPLQKVWGHFSTYKKIVIIVFKIHLCPSFLKTSPPSARVAAMSHMQHETSLKHLNIFLKLPWHTFETLWNHPWNNLDTLLKPPWNLLKKPWNFLDHPCKSLETPRKFLWKTLKTFLELLVNFWKTCQKQNSLLQPQKHEISFHSFWNTPLKHPSIFLKTTLKFS